jgi:dolichol kinase
MSSFVDARDSGLVFVSHFALLLGMAAPVWLSAALREEDGGGEGATGGGGGGGGGPWAAGLAGVVVLGVGDTMASVVGRRWGRTPVARGSPKTVEGTAGGAAAALAAWGALAWAAPALREASSWGGGGGGGVAAGFAAATAAAAVLEAATAQLDNLVVPLQYFALLCLL